MDISTKITNFINAKTHKAVKVKVVHRKIEEGLSFSDSVKNNKWTTRKLNAAKDSTERELYFYLRDYDKEPKRTSSKKLGRKPSGGVSRRHFVRGRQWIANSWKRHHGINIYKMGHNRFLFECPSKTAADHTISGEWFWKCQKFALQWWSVTSTSTFERLDQGWIRVVGIPLHLWSQNIFHEIGNFSSGWIQTEEERELRHHLKWARLKVRGKGDDVPSSVELVHEGLTFNVQI